MPLKVSPSKLTKTKGDLKDYFGQFGDIANCIIKYKSDTSKTTLKCFLKPTIAFLID